MNPKAGGDGDLQPLLLGLAIAKFVVIRGTRGRPKGMILMDLIRRVCALTAGVVMAALVLVTMSACGGASAPTNGLEQKSPADVLQQAAGSLKAATSVHIVGGGSDGRIDARIRQDAATGTLTKDGQQVRVTIIGADGYISADMAGLAMMGVPAEVRSQVAGRWLKFPASNFTGFTLSDLASQLTAYRGPLEPKVSQAMLDGKQVVVVSWRDGSKLYVANTGPGYPLHGDLKGSGAGQLDFTEYGGHFQVTTPGNVLNVSESG